MRASEPDKEIAEAARYLLRNFAHRVFLTYQIKAFNFFFFCGMYVCMYVSILHVLCGKGQVDAVAAVLKIGVDVDLLDKVGFYNCIE